MPVSNQNMGYDPREMLATFYQHRAAAMANVNNPNAPVSMVTMLQKPVPVSGLPMMGGGVQPPEVPMGGLIFGGFRAKGGPVQPGRAYVVGERGPELMVPQVPGTIVPNTGAAASPMNRPYAELAGSTTGSLANRGTRPVGRSANDPGRMNEMAMRRLRSQGDIVGAARLANSNAWLDARMGGPAMRTPQPMPLMPMNAGLPAQPRPMPMPSAPMGGFEDMADASTMTPAAQMEPSAPPTFEQAFNASPLAGAGPAPMSQPFQPMQVPAGTFAQMPGLNAGAFKGAYQEAPPLMSSVPIPGTDQMQPMVMGQPKGAPVTRAQPPKPAEWQAPKMYDETIPEQRDANGSVTQPARTRQYYFVPDPQTGKPRKEYALDADGDGVPDAQQPGWMGWLQSQK